MNWIRVAVAVADDPDVHLLADALGVRVAETVGLVVGLLVHFPEHAPDGSLAKVPDSLVERWAGWEGERGAFAPELRRIFLTDAGVWASWEKHNGAAIREANASRDRAAEYRRKKAEGLASTPNGTANGTPNGPTYGPPLRTNVRTNITTGSLARLNGTSYAPGHVNLTPPTFCPDCGDGVLATVAGQKRPVRVHAHDCPTHAERTA